MENWEYNQNLMQMIELTLLLCFFVYMLIVCGWVCVCEKGRAGAGRGWKRWGQGRSGGHYTQQGNIELAQTNSHNDP